MVRIIDCETLSDGSDTAQTYRLLPLRVDEAYYRERVDRNLGWITSFEQEILRQSKVAIAGCGGMGAALAERLLRLGVGEIRIADCEVFDVSNINRQLAATRSSVGKNKAITTAQALRRITDDTTIVVYPQGVSEATAPSFVEGCDVVCDEIEFWELEAAILLHQAARNAGVSIFGCNTCGFGTHLFLFTPQSQKIEDAFGVDLLQARRIDSQMHSHTISQDDKRQLMQMLVQVVTPAITEYCPEDSRADLKAVYARLLDEGKAPIISTNPALATGFIADRVLLYLLRDSGVKRQIVEVPPMPGYLYFDAAKMTTVVARG